MGEVFDNNLKRMQFRRQKRWWNAYMLFYTRCDQKTTYIKSIKEQLSLAESRQCILPMPEPIERSVRIQNIRFLHSRSIFTVEFFVFIRKLVASAAQPLRAEKLVSSSPVQCGSIQANGIFHRINVLHFLHHFRHRKWKNSHCLAYNWDHNFYFIPDSIQRRHCVAQQSIGKFNFSKRCKRKISSIPNQFRCHFCFICKGMKRCSNTFGIRLACDTGLLKMHCSAHPHVWPNTYWSHHRPKYATYSSN